ncbi:MAG TPA: metallophosphoesterase [Candidatus Binatia bacterium]|nr:metallophosphoesterase [Candidatus Binatia bacterium]
MEPPVTIAAVADIHCKRTSRGELRALFARMAESADVLCLCGDLTDYGLPEEATILAGELAVVGDKPLLAVFGNHDHESGKADEVERILCDAGVKLLDGESFEYRGVGFAGTKGFGGGFGEYALQSWGEVSIKHFVQEAVDESLKLDRALARLDVPKRVALLHYAPIQATVEGEAPVLFPFLGSSRLEEPLNRHPVAAVLHGHAHAGSPAGRTASNVPVYNVSVPTLLRWRPDQPAFRLLEVVPEAPAVDGAARTA